MTYKREGERVTLEMTVADYERLLLILGYKAGAARSEQDMRMFWASIDFVNELNRTNPNYRPYDIPPEYAPNARGKPA